jgi:hypothetical protein
MADEIKSFCAQRQIKVLGELAHDPGFTAATVSGKTITEYRCDADAEQVRQIWATIMDHIEMAQSVKSGRVLEIN